MSPSPFRFSVLASAGLVVLGALVVGCGDEGAVPKQCPDLPLYNVKHRVANAASRAAQDKILKEAIEIGCITGLGDASTVGQKPPPTTGKP